jgi:hypothetical protein
VCTKRVFVTNIWCTPKIEHQITRFRCGDRSSTKHTSNTKQADTKSISALASQLISEPSGKRAVLGSLEALLSCTPLVRMQRKQERDGTDGGDVAAGKGIAQGDARWPRRLGRDCIRQRLSSGARKRLPFEAMQAMLTFHAALHRCLSTISPKLKLPAISLHQEHSARIWSTHAWGWTIRA